MTLKDVCELTDNNHFDEATQKCVTSTAAVETMQVKIALLDTTGNGSGKQVACDTLAMENRTVPKSTGVLTEAMKALFAEPATPSQPDPKYNFIARTNSTLKFDHATIENGTANIYLTGSLSGLAGTCDDPRASFQIKETALQFSTVKKVQLYLNGTATTLIPSEK
jgi:hypothetical protein